MGNGRAAGGPADGRCSGIRLAGPVAVPFPTSVLAYAPRGGGSPRDDTTRQALCAHRLIPLPRLGPKSPVGWDSLYLSLTQGSLAQLLEHSLVLVAADLAARIALL